MKSVSVATLLISAVCAAKLEPLTADTLQFTIEDVDISRDQYGQVSVALGGSAPRNIGGVPDLPLVRRAVVLPEGSSAVTVELEDVDVETLPLSTWGSSIKPSQGLQPLKTLNHTLFSADQQLYAGLYPPAGVGVGPALVHTWRDVQGTVVELNPIAVDHEAGLVHILRKATVKVVSDVSSASVLAPKLVDPDFMDAYSFVYANWREVSHLFKASDQPGRVLVVYDSKFEAQAEKYSDLVEKRMGQKPLMYEADSSSGIQSKIKDHYKEVESLSYVTIIGRDVPTLRGSKTGGKECDHCYVMMSGGVSLDLFIGRLSGSTVQDIETQLTKISNYDESSTEPWTKQAFGSAFNLAGDEYSTMTKEMENLEELGFTKHDWVHGGSTNAQHIFEQMNQGLGVFTYLGHGQGDAWDTPMMTLSGIRSLTNQKMPFFEIDVSCDNGGFQTYRPCMGEGLLTATGGAIATMMHAPEARGTMCKQYMVQATVALKEGKVKRVGSVYTAALMAAQAMDPDDYAVQGYNTFGDPTLRLPFAAGASVVVV